MKVKQYLYIHDTCGFMRNPHGSCYTISDYAEMGSCGWILCGEIELDVDVDSGKVIEQAKAGLDTEIGKHTAAINVLENRKNELLALTHGVAA